MAVSTGKLISARWLARAAFALVLAAAADLVGFADLASLAMVAVGAVGACLMLAGGYWFLAHRGVLRWVAFAVVPTPRWCAARPTGTTNGAPRCRSCPNC
jgi:hypothetical protein